MSVAQSTAPAPSPPPPTPSSQRAGSSEGSPTRHIATSGASTSAQSTTSPRPSSLTWKKFGAANSSVMASLAR